MQDLVKNRKGEAVTSSLIIADKFKKSHKRVLESIGKLKSEVSNLMAEKTAMKDVYIFQEQYRTVRGRKFKHYTMNRNAFSILAMGFTGKKALKWKLDFISAFNAMENSLLNQRDLGWKQVRDDSKNMRLEFTDSINEFSEYAKEQGSKSPYRYYGNITKMEYAALRLIEYREKVPSNFRDTLDRMQLHMIVMAEHVANETIKQGMIDKLHYREIFLLAKQAVIKYSETVLFNQKQIEES